MTRGKSSGGCWGRVQGRRQPHPSCAAVGKVIPGIISRGVSVDFFSPVWGPEMLVSCSQCLALSLHMPRAGREFALTAQPPSLSHVQLGFILPRELVGERSRFILISHQKPDHWDAAHAPATFPSKILRMLPGCFQLWAGMAPGFRKEMF